MADFKARISQDRFGNSYQLKFAGQVINRKSGEVLDSIYETYIELGGKLYKIEISNANKTKLKKGTEVSGLWVKVTKKEQRKQAGSM